MPVWRECDALLGGEKAELGASGKRKKRDGDNSKSDSKANVHKKTLPFSERRQEAPRPPVFNCAYSKSGEIFA